MKDDHWLLPVDPTPEEKEVFLLSLENIYAQFDDPIDKLLIALIYELNYPRSFVSKVVKRQPLAVGIRLKKIRTVLAKTYRLHLKTIEKQQE